MEFKFLPRLFEERMMLSTVLISIWWIAKYFLMTLIRRIAIDLLDCVIRPSRPIQADAAIFLFVFHEWPELVTKCEWVGWRQSLSLIDDDGFLTQSSTVRILFNFVEKMDE